MDGSLLTADPTIIICNINQDISGVVSIGQLV